MSQTITARKAEIHDAQAIHDLINLYAQRGEMLPRTMGEVFENLRDFYVVRPEGGELMGCVALHIVWSDLAEVKSLAVPENVASRRVMEHAGLRYEQWKAVFMEQKAHGFSVWAQPMVQLRLPMLFNLRSDPFERAQHEAGDYVRWFVEHAFVLVPAQAVVGQHLVSFQQFPPRQKPGSFSVEQAMEKLRNPPPSN